jgi:hypothetical protein
MTAAPPNGGAGALAAHTPGSARTDGAQAWAAPGPTPRSPRFRWPRKTKPRTLAAACAPRPCCTRCASSSPAGKEGAAPRRASGGATWCPHQTLMQGGLRFSAAQVFLHLAPDWPGDLDDETSVRGLALLAVLAIRCGKGAASDATASKLASKGLKMWVLEIGR